MAGWVYIISNKAMPGILKIGYTERTPDIRAYELYHTGCPYPYKVDYAIYVDRPYEVEQKTHELQRKTNVGKEWFSCSCDDAVLSINEAIKQVGARIDISRRPPAPTPEELDGVLKANPAAKAIINRVNKIPDTKIKQEDEKNLQWQKNRITDIKKELENYWSKAILFAFTVGSLVFILPAGALMVLVNWLTGENHTAGWGFWAYYFYSIPISFLFSIYQYFSDKRKLNKLSSDLNKS